MSTFRAHLLSLAIAAAIGGAAHAQPPTGPCDADVAKFCKDAAAPGGGRYRCLKAHEKELSDACKQHVADVGSKARGIKDACWDDVGRFCKDSRPGRGRILQCLKAHESELSEPCKAALTPAGKK